MFFICKDDKVSERVARKLSEQVKPGAIIPLDREEMEAYKDFQLISVMDGKGDLVEVKPETMYLMVVDSNKTCLDDCAEFCKSAFKQVGAVIRVVRTK